MEGDVAQNNSKRHEIADAASPRTPGSFSRPSSSGSSSCPLWTSTTIRSKEKAVKMQCMRSDPTQKELQSMSKVQCHDKLVAQESDEQVFAGRQGVALID